jgi:hypothetical protein
MMSSRLTARRSTQVERAIVLRLSNEKAILVSRKWWSKFLKRLSPK